MKYLAVMVIVLAFAGLEASPPKYLDGTVLLAESSAFNSSQPLVMSGGKDYCFSNSDCRKYFGSDSFCYAGQCYCDYGCAIIANTCVRQRCSSKYDCFNAGYAAAKCSGGGCYCSGYISGNVCYGSASKASFGIGMILALALFAIRF